MTELSETNGLDIFSGCGNGTLHITVIQDPAHWDGSADSHLRVCFNYDDWKSIFRDVLHCPEGDAYVKGEDIKEFWERNRQIFQQSIPEYPMLGRIFDMYEDYVFTPEEVERLREECLRVQSFASNPAADLGLRKLIYSCDEASKRGSHLLFSCD